RMPAAARDGLVAFLHRGGKLFCAGPPLLGEPLFRAGGGWLTLGQLRDRRRTSPVTERFESTGSPAAARWQRASDNMAAPSRLTVEQSPYGAALRLEVRALRGWDNFSRAFDAPPFRRGSSLTCFWGRSGRAADHLAVEWQ